MLYASHAPDRSSVKTELLCSDALCLVLCDSNSRVLSGM